MQKVFLVEGAARARIVHNGDTWRGLVSGTAGRLIGLMACIIELQDYGGAGVTSLVVAVVAPPVHLPALHLCSSSHMLPG